MPQSAPLRSRHLSPRLLLPLALLLAAQSARAVPAAMHLLLRVDHANGPLSTVDLSARLYEQANGGAVLWSEEFVAAPVVDGLVSLQLGSSTPLDELVFDGAPRYLALSIDNQELSPRLPVLSVPYALRAAVADDASTLGGLMPTEFVTTVEVGTGLSAQRTGSAVSLTLDTAQLQLRVSGQCPTGSAISRIGPEGTVDCEVDDRGPSYSAGAGLSLDGTTLAVDSSSVARKDAAAGDQAFDTTTLYLDYANHRVGVGTSAPATALDVTGTARALDFAYANPRAQVYSLPGNTFVSGAAGSTWVGMEGGYGYLAGGMIAELFAPVRLPAGAIVYGMACEIVDGVAGGGTKLQDSLFSLMRRARGTTTYEPLAQIFLSASIDTAPGMTDFLVDDTVVNGAIDNSNNDYLVSVIWYPSTYSPLLRFYGCQLGYTVPGPT